MGPFFVMLYNNIITSVKVVAIVLGVAVINLPAPNTDEVAKKCRQTSDAGCVDIDSLGSLQAKKCRQTSDAGCVDIDSLGS